MKRHPRLCLSVIGFLIVSLCFAQTSPYVLTTYDLNQLDARPGRILVSPDVLTLLEFDDQVEDVATARPDALTIEVSGNVIRLRANWRAGGTDLVVTVANQTAMFTVDIDPESRTTRRYLIEKPKPPVPASSSATRSGGAAALKEAEGEGELPDWLSASFSILSVSGEETVIQYGLKNTGENDIVTDPLRLKVVQGDYTVPFRLERLNTGGSVSRIKPSYAEYGTILIEDPLPSKLTLLWDLIEVGPGHTHTLRKDFHEGLLEQVR